MTITGTGNTPDVVDVVALGESMVAFLPTRPGRLADVPSFDRSIGGAESNVACALAGAGHTVRWVSRVGADGFGDHLVETIGSYGVDVSAVRRDPVRPTGVYFRTAGDRGTDAHEVVYFRAGSAASAMSATGVDPVAVRAGRILHVSGITAALSGGCLSLLRELTAPRESRPLVSFDVNHRPGLWPDGTDSRVLLELARGADVVFVGEDEAGAAWGVRGGPEEIRALLPEPEVLVVKEGAKGATVFQESASVFQPALQVDVVATTGAGDAFAAGFLSATLRDLPLRDRIRHGHLWAAAALTAPGDLAPPPARDTADRLAALGDDAWGTLRLGPGWTQAGQRAEEEVRTP
ncbi:sugar kinase [Streptomyces sp. P17]|uniref:sugar kinase n=1 Tax=Streptomyces sp. P17 TaxID=3074716 RepID=UPI0028F3EEF9|nr:sugar kinase [Streptomyces sp. P17]MDT9698845.1 sugar kinase [Streptomyces sp. P17]